MTKRKPITRREIAKQREAALKALREKLAQEREQKGRE